jgi:hypothetical protein
MLDSLEEDAQRCPPKGRFMNKLGWLFLSVAEGVELALASSSVHRVVDRGNPDFEGFKAEAVDLAAFLEVEPDRTLPQVIVVLRSGAAWLVGDASLQRERESLAYLSLRPEYLASAPPWCRGVLRDPTHWAYVVEEGAVA